MAKQRTNKSCWQSKYGGDWITDAQHLAEVMCERMAASRKTSLPTKFWERDEWKRSFCLQLRHANSLLSVYPIKAIKAALTMKKGLYSLAWKGLDEIIKQQHQKIMLETKREESSSSSASPPTEGLPAKSTNELPRTKKNETVAERLKGLDQ